MKNSGLICIISIIIVHLSAYFIVRSAYAELNVNVLIKEISYSGVILILGTLIMYVKFKKDQFVNRFMAVTVFQMLAILTFVAAMVYLKMKPVRTHGLLFIFTYLTGMVVQTVFFLRFSKETSN